MEDKRNARFSVRQRIKSFRYALNGLKILIREEHNSRIHLIVTIIVVIMGIWLQISAYDWIALCLSIGLVFSAEIINSAIENLSDYISPDSQKLIKKAKDLAAAAVLVCSFIAVIVGLIVFIPKVIILLD